MAELAKHIVVRRKGGSKESGDVIEIDGQEFPWYITSDGVTAHMARTDLTTITIKIPAEKVEFMDTPWLTPKADE